MGSAFSAAAISGAGVLPGPATPEPSAAPSACLFVCVPAPGVGSPTGAASATGSASQHEHAWEFPRCERHRRRLSSWERSRSGKKRCGGRSPSPAGSSPPALPSASSSSPSSVADVQEGAIPPPPAGRSGMGGGRSESDRSPRPSPSGLGLGSRSSPVAGPSLSGDGGRSSPSPSGAGDDDRSSMVDSFRAVLRLIWELHSLEELTSVALNWCKTSLALVFGLQ